VLARRFFYSAILAATALMPVPALAQAPLRVVTTATDYASLTELVGGEHVKVTSITNGAENIHKVVATPSKMRDLHDADLFIHTGLDLETWVPELLRGSRNAKIQEGKPGNVDCSKGIKLKEVPKQLTRAQGDIHIYGNPHYMLDPINHVLVTRTIRDALKTARPAQESYFDERYAEFEQRMKTKIAEWLVKMKSHKGAKIVGYHNVLPYFADRFGLEVIGYVEEKPGISPSPSYTARLIERMRETGTRVLLTNTYAERQTADALARATNAQTVIFPDWARGVPDTPDVFAVFDYRIDRIAAALEKVGAAVGDESTQQ
jgi:zinc/manganese transport system substrate-binding protein